MISPAKINLGLTIHHRRQEDGYHLLSSIFLPISFGDEICFDYAPAPLLTTDNHLEGPQRDEFEAVSERGDPTKNILWKGLTALTELGAGNISVHVTKRIPPGAGLGGGSSNAGMLLNYARARFKLDETTLRTIAVRLGADVPFFLANRPMYVTGIGEVMEEIEVGRGWGVLALPGVAINTKSAYAELKRTLQKGYPQKSLSSLESDLIDSLRLSRWESVGRLKNDFEEVVFRRHPALERIKQGFLETGSTYASLSGSGSALYGLVPSPARQEEVIRRMRDRFPDSKFLEFHF